MGLAVVTKVKQTSPLELTLSWSDGIRTIVSMKALRDACPCAGCKGETVLLHTYTPPRPHLETPGRYELKAIETVGGYALKFTWGDGHNTGIYTWEHLRGLQPGNESLR